jgi:hypothetical protein
MLRTISITNLRGIKEGKIDGFAPATILVGPNNCGKSTVLDAILLGASPVPQDVLEQLAGRRVHPAARAWIFHRNRQGSQEPVAIDIASDAPHARRTEVYSRGNDLEASWFEPNAPVEARGPRIELNLSNKIVLYRGAQLEDIPEVRLIDASSAAMTTPAARRRPRGGGTGQASLSNLPELFSAVAKRGLRDLVKNILKALISQLEDVEVLVDDDRQPFLYFYYPWGAYPAEVAGDGIRLLTTLSLELASPFGGIVLLEEPEAHLHPGAIKQASLAIHAAVTRGIQVVLTTHSLDMIDALLATFGTSSDLDKLAVFRLRLDQETLKSRRISGADAAMARAEIQEDLR